MMKKLFIGLSSTLFAFVLTAQEPPSVGPIYINTGTSATNMAASSTNTGSGTMIPLHDSPNPVRIYVSAQGNAGTTNASSSVSNLVVRFSTASGSLQVTNNFDTASLSNIKLSVPSLLTASNTVSDWFQIQGARYIRVGQIENNYVGSVSNIQVIICYPK